MIYLDNSATTKCSEKAKEIMCRVLDEDYGNPSSLHGMGVSAEHYLRSTREVIAKSLHVKDREIIFTSGGSEANNLGLKCTALAYKRSGMHIITTPIEHPSVKNALKYLEDMYGYEITKVPVDSRGVVDMRALSDEIREDTIMVAIMHVNNEIGTVEPIEEIGTLIKQKNPNTLFFVDAVQSYGKLPINPAKAKIDLMSVSGHKIHGPKGSGFLYKKDGVKMQPMIHGGGQEWGFRSGTENVPAIAGLGIAADEAMRAMADGRIDEMSRLRDGFAAKLKEIEGVSVNGPAGFSGENAKSEAGVAEAAPHIISVSVDGVRAEVLLHALEDEGVYVSAGSACSSHKPTPSDTLTAIGLPKNLIESTIRFSMSIHTTKEELDIAAERLSEIVPKLRKFTRR